MTEQVKPKTQLAIEHLDNALQEMNKAIRIFNSVIMDLEKGATFISTYRDSLIKSIEGAGGDVQRAIEAQIKDFLPKRLRENIPPMPNADKQEQTGG
jgi:hypothetical protein